VESHGFIQYFAAVFQRQACRGVSSYCRGSRHCDKTNLMFYIMYDGLKSVKVQSSTLQNKSTPQKSILFTVLQLKQTRVVIITICQNNK